MGVNTILIYGGIICFLGIVILLMVYYFWKFHNHSEVDYSKRTELHQNGATEKREQPRADINWVVSIETSDGKIEAQAKNISLGGAFICCKRPLLVGEVFPLTMLGSDHEPVMVTAKVVWSNVNVPEEKVINRGMGVRFLKMSDRHIRLVRQIVEEKS